MKKQNQTESPSIGKYINNLRHIHAIEYCVALIMNELGIYVYVHIK